MTLTGTLEAFGVAEVLELLVVTGKTGCLSIDGDGGQGRVWVRDGAVAAGSTDRVADAPLDEVLCDLLRYHGGAFTFEEDERSPTVTRPEPLDDLLLRAGALLSEWRELESAVPSMTYWVRLVDTLPDGDQVTVAADQWPALVAVGDGCSVADLAHRLELNELNALRTVHDLMRSGLTTIEATRRPARPARRPASTRTRPRR